MIRNKAQADAHVSNIIGHLKSQHEVHLRGYNFAKLYCEVKEYNKAVEYMKDYLMVKTNDAGAYKYLGHIHQLASKEITLDCFRAYKKAYKLDKSQKDALLKICQYLTEKDVTAEDYMYWADKLEESHPSSPLIALLRVKTKENSIQNSDGPMDLIPHYEEELKKAPGTIESRIKLLQTFSKVHRHESALKLVSETIASKLTAPYKSIKWLEAVVASLDAFTTAKPDEITLEVNYFYFHHLILLLLNTIQQAPDNHMPTLLLWKLDTKVSALADKMASQKCSSAENAFLKEMSAQLLFYAGIVILNKSIKDKVLWKHTVDAAYACMLASTTVSDFHDVIPTPSNHHLASLRKKMHSLSSFRLSQAGHMARRRFEKELTGGKWVARLQRDYMHPTGKESIVKLLYKNSKFPSASTPSPNHSYLLRTDLFSNVIIIPSYASLIDFDKSLHDWCMEDLACVVWISLNHSMPQLYSDLPYDHANFTASSAPVCQLDVQTFLLASMHCSKERQSATQTTDSHHPPILPLPLSSQLITQTQADWWSSLYSLHKSSTLGENLSKYHATVQRGVEVVRALGQHGMSFTLLVHLAKSLASKKHKHKGKDEGNMRGDVEDVMLTIRCSHLWTQAMSLIQACLDKKPIPTSEGTLFELRSNSTISEKQLLIWLEEGRARKVALLREEGKLKEAMEILDGADPTPWSLYHSAMIHLEMLIRDDDNGMNTDTHFHQAKSSLLCVLQLISDDGDAKEYEELKGMANTELQKINNILNSVSIFNKTDKENTQMTSFGVSKTTYSPNYNHFNNNAHLNNNTPNQHYNNNHHNSHHHHHQNNNQNYNQPSDSCTEYDQDFIIASTPCVSKKNSRIVKTERRSFSSYPEHMLTSLMADNKELLERVVTIETKLQTPEVYTNKDEKKQISEKISTLQNSLRTAEDRIVVLQRMDTNNKEDNRKLSERLVLLESKLQMLEVSIKDNSLLATLQASHNMLPNNFYPPTAPMYPVMHPDPRLARMPFIPPTTTPLNHFANQMLLHDMIRTPPPSQNNPPPPTIHATSASYMSNEVNNYPGNSSYYDDYQYEDEPQPSKTGNKAFEAGFFAVSTLNSNTQQLSKPSTTTSFNPASTIIQTQNLNLSQLLSKKNDSIKLDEGKKSYLKTTPALTNTDSKSLAITKSTVLSSSTASSTISAPKTVFGGLTFSSQAIVKQDIQKNTSKSTPTTTSAPNVFSNFSFFTGSSKPSATTVSTFISSSSNSIFSTPPTSQNESTNKNVNVSNHSEIETVEEYEPAVNFTPVVSLALVSVVTGEEDDEKVFGEYAKLYRMDNAQWKERGSGEMKVLRNKSSGKFRMLMRREQVLKVCLNHYVHPTMKMVDLKSSKNSFCWFARDFSDAAIKEEQFCVKFKTKEIADKFRSTFDSCIEKLKNTNLKGELKKDLEASTKPIKESKSKTAQVPCKEGPVKLSQLFKKKEGDWECDACYVKNTGKDLKCLSCESPKPGAPVVVSTSSSSASSFTFGSKGGFTFGGTAASSPSSFSASTTQSFSASTTQSFSPSKTQSFAASKTQSFAPTNLSTNTFANTFGTQPNAGFGQLNTGFGQSNTGFGQSFSTSSQPSTGFGQSFAASSQPNTGVTFSSSIFGTATTQSALFGTSAVKTSGFGTFSTQGFEVSTSTSSIPSKATSLFAASTSTFTMPSFTASSSTTTTKSLFPIFTPSKSSTTTISFTPTTSSVLSTTPSSSTFHFNKSDTVNKSFFSNFNSTPKNQSETTPTKATPIITPQSPGNGMYKNTDGEDDHIFFEPIVSLPEHYDIKTGEEDENVEFCSRAKLYRFMINEWKERGVGEMKVLRHRTTAQTRLLMRREKVLKPCCNHLLSHTMKLEPMPQANKKAWIWYAVDSSEDESAVTQFCIKFSSEELAKQFKEAFDKAVARLTKGDKKDEDSGDVVSGVKKLSVTDKEDDCVITAVEEPTSSLQHKSQQLQLPNNFYNYVNQQDCSGCIGCNDDLFDFESIGKTAVKAEEKTSVETSQFSSMSLTTSIVTTATSTPTTQSFFQKSSLFPTTICSPFSFNKTSSNTNIFSTTGVSSAPSSTNQLFSNSSTHSTTPLNTFKPTSSKSNLFSSSNPNPFVPAVSLSKTSSGAFVFPTIQTSSTSLPTKPLFEQPLFGIPMNNVSTSSSTNLVFGSKSSGFGNLNPPRLTIASAILNPPTFSKSNIFATTTTNIFATTTTNSFAPVASSATTTTASSSSFFFGLSKNTSTTSVPSTQAVFGQSSSLFANSLGVSNPSITATKSPTNTPPSTPPKTIFGAALNIVDFSNLSAPTETAFKKDSDDKFKWAGTGDKLFSNSNKKDNKTNNNSDAQDDVEEEPDVHFEPVVQLPELVDIRTGEEGEEVLFKEMATLYCWHEDGQWKERGVGDMKVLLNRTNGSVRLLHRRYQVYKVACNHVLHKAMKFGVMQSNEKAWCWVANDFSEEELKLVKLAVRFKSVELAKNFKKIIDNCQQNMDDANKFNLSTTTLTKTTQNTTLTKTTQNTTPVPSSFYQESNGVGSGYGVVSSYHQTGNSYDDGRVADNGGANNDDDDGGECDEDDYTEEDYDEQRVLFEKRATLVYDDPDPQNIGQVVVMISEDYDVTGLRVSMTTDDNDMVCNHIICKGYSIDKWDGRRNSCCWKAKDYATDEPVRKTFYVTFSSDHALNDFISNYEIGIKIAEDKDICENAQDEFDYSLE